MYQLQQLRPILKALGQTGAVLIGGQAVNLWSERFQRPQETPWKELRPYTSVDVDLLGNQADVKALAQKLASQIELPDDPAHTPNIAKLHCANPQIDIDVLHSVNGLNPAEALQTAVQLKFADIPLRVLHPVLCIESKTINLLTLDQQVAGRQDEKHLRLSIANCREFLASLTLNRSPEDLLAWAERLRTHANTHFGLNIQHRYRLRFINAIPREKWRGAPAPLQLWVEQVGPEWEREVEQKIQDTLEVEEWLQRLRSKQKRPGFDL
jgi:hypothetical protein